MSGQLFAAISGRRRPELGALAASTRPAAHPPSSSGAERGCERGVMTHVKQCLQTLYAFGPRDLAVSSHGREEESHDGAARARPNQRCFKGVTSRSPGQQADGASDVDGAQQGEQERDNVQASHVLLQRKPSRPTIGHAKTVAVPWGVLRLSAGKWTNTLH